MMKYEFSTRRYEAAHGKSPRGRGWWAFEVADKTMFVSGNITLTEAKKKIAAQVASLGYPAGTIIHIAA